MGEPPPPGGGWRWRGSAACQVMPVDTTIPSGSFLQTRSSVLPRKLLAERTLTLLLCVCATRVTGGRCSMQHANALLLCCIAQRPDIEAETRVVVRGQDADELILCYRCGLASAQVWLRHRRREGASTCIHAWSNTDTCSEARLLWCCSKQASPCRYTRSSASATRRDKTRRDMGGMTSRIPWRVQQCRKTSATWT